MYTFTATCIVSVVFFASLTIGQEIFPGSFAYDTHTESVNISCNDKVWSKESPVAFLLNGTTIFNSTNATQTAIYVKYDSKENKTLTLLTKGRVEGFPNLTCIQGGKSSKALTIFAVNTLKLEVSPPKMTVNSSNTFTCHWKIQPLQELTASSYHAAIQYNTTTYDEKNILAKFVPSLGVQAGTFAASHWNVTSGNDTTKFEFTAKSLNQTSEGKYACILTIGQLGQQQQNFMSNVWQTSSASSLSHQFVAVILTLFVACNGFFV